jgi:hypothetical protein
MTAFAINRLDSEGMRVKAAFIGHLLIRYKFLPCWPWTCEAIFPLNKRACQDNVILSRIDAKKSLSLLSRKTLLTWADDGRNPQCPIRTKILTEFYKAI